MSRGVTTRRTISTGIIPLYKAINSPCICFSGQPGECNGATQKWSRSILEEYYGNALANAYLGDEDQGQMSAWFMWHRSVFQTDGGCNVAPVYEDRESVV